MGKKPLVALCTLGLLAGIAIGPGYWGYAATSPARKWPASGPSNQTPRSSR